MSSFKLYKQLLQTHYTDNSENGAKDESRHFTKANIQGATKHIKVSSTH